MPDSVAVIGGGAWGTAIACVVARNNIPTRLWAREPEVVVSVNQQHENTMFLAGIPLPERINATSNLVDVITSQIIFMVPPSQFLGSICHDLKKAGLKKDTILVICSKGIEQSSLKLMSEVVADILPNPIAVMSGPTFASEVAKGLPASVTLAAEDEKILDRVCAVVEAEHFKVYYCNDIIGAEIGGAVKNVIAIACGIAEGSQLGKNAVAALITRGVKEMKRLCVKKGGKPKTLMELCGVGDLILTCSSQESRNMSLGYALGQGKPFEEIMKNRRTVAEGVASAESVTALARHLEVSVPICEAVNKIVHGKADVKKTIKELIRSS